MRCSKFPWNVRQFVLTLLIVCGGARAGAVELEFSARHAPQQPKSGERVVITATAPESTKADSLSLQYQIVEPGKYIALADPAYLRSWSDVPLIKTGAGNTFTAELPETLQRNRRLIRYRIYARETKAVLAPRPDDPRRNYGYFVYDGIPEWRAAINPNGSRTDSKVTLFDKSVMGSVQAYHLISKTQSIENVTWREPRYYSHPSASEYKYTGTLVSAGKVYDHIRFRARGGTWRYAMGKNMWKIDFNKGDHFEALDNWGRKYQTKWDKLNLGACIQQGSYGMRGEHGMFEAITYQLFNLAGVEAPRTHWVQLRVVDSAEESPANQYHGDFWGLYLVVENVDGDFLKEHALPDGNLYKMDFGGPETEYLAEGQAEGGADVLRFIQEMRANPGAPWWRSTVDLERYYSYRSILECVHHYDIGMGKNYFYFHNLSARRWQVVPWDVDLTWADHMFGNGAEPFYRTGLLHRDPFKTEYETRLAEIRDLLFNEEQTGALIDQYARVIAPSGNAPSGNAPSIAAADRAKWDYHPIMSSELVVPDKSAPGLFYRSSPTRDFSGMLQLMKRYVKDRGRWIDQALLGAAKSPSKPTIAPLDKIDFSAPKLSVQLAGSISAERVEWRVGKITPAAKNQSPAAPQAPSYEINAILHMEGGRTAEIPTMTFQPGQRYRIRARLRDANGVWSRWSDGLQLTRPAKE